MACAVDPLAARQLSKQPSSTSMHSLETLLSTDSTVEQSAIDQVMNRRWTFSEVSDLLHAQLAVLAGGRDKNGGAIIVIQGSPQVEYRTLEVGKVLSYLIRIPPDVVQQRGFTVVMDMRRVSWSQTKRVLDALKVLFLDHIHQVLVMRPKSFWQRQRSGMSFNTRKSKYRFKCVMLEHSADLYNHLSSTQMPIAQNGYLDYNHQQWMDTQRVLEQFLLDFLSRRDTYESLKGLLEHYKDPETLYDAKEAVRQHVQLRDKLNRPDLDHQCERMTHIMGKLRPGTSNPDFQASFQFLEELGVSLRNSLSILEGLWESKGTKLDHGLQHKLFEHDSEKLIDWMDQQCRLLSRQLTDIGADSKTASVAMKSVDEYKSSIQMSLQDVARVITMSERLVQASHPAAEVITSRAGDMRSERDKLVGVVEARVALVQLSVLFHDKLNTFFQQSEAWADMCSSHDQPADTRATEEAIQQHHRMKEQYNQLYNDARRDGHTIIEQLRRPVGDSSVPSQFIIGSRHVKEDLENLYDEKNLLDGQWDVRNNFLKQTLNFRLYQRETHKILTWIDDVGNMFLITNNSIGVDIVSSEHLVKRHDTFDMDSELVYGQSSKLISKATQLAAKQDCPPQQVKEEAASLEAAINNFANRLDERREIMLQAVICFKASDSALKELASIQVPIPATQFEGPSGAVEEHLLLFRGSHEAACRMADSVLAQWNTLRARLRSAQATNVTANCNMEYTPAVETVDSKIAQLLDEKNKMERYCETREQRWTWCLQRNQLILNVEKHLTEQEVWLRDQSDTLELAENEEEARLRLDIFQRQYTTLVESHDNLIESGHHLNQHINQLDQELFNKDIGRGMREKVERMVGRVKERRTRMERQAAPRLQLLQQCQKYFVHDQAAQELLVGLKELSRSMTKLTGVGHSLKEAQVLQQKVADAIKILQELEGRGQSFAHMIESSVGERHYQAVMLRVKCTTITNKLAGIKRALADQQIAIKGSVEFHQTYEKLQSLLQHCHTQFSSRDSSLHSLENIEKQQYSNNEMKVFIEENTGVVGSHGHQLIAMLRSIATTAFVVGGAEPMDNGNDEVDNGREEVESGRLVVLTRKRVPSSRSRSPISPQPEEQGHTVIQGLVDKMATDVANLSQLWAKRNAQLEQCKKAIEFEQQVPVVFKWLDNVGVVFLKRRHDYGRSLEEVKLRLEECSVFEREKVAPVSQQVDRLRSMMEQFEDAGHYELNKLRGQWSQLDKRWKSFEDDMKTRMTNLELSLSFQDNVFEGSNWCQKSEQLLQELEQRMSECDTASEVASLIEELTIYLSVTREEQMGRVNKIKQISMFLHSNSLVELGSQVEASTQSMLREINGVQDELQSLHDKLARIEEEKDRERRLIKQKERVLDEIVDTEQIYTRDLRLVVEVCLPRYMSASRSEGWPPSLKGKDHIVFGNVKAIKEYHAEELLPQLEEAAKGGLDGVAQLFVKEASAIASFYVPYCQNKTASDDLMASHRSYLSRVQNQLGIEDPLSSLLIKPIQRITKYPLLLKDALKYTTQLGQPTAILEQALEVVQEIPVQTNNAIHLSLLDMGEESTHRLGELIYQGVVMVSEPRLLLTVEKERQVFVFERGVVFSRRVELGQAKFKYEYKFKMALTSGVQIIDNMESEPCKFGVFTSDHRIHLKAPTAVIKGQWVRALRIAAQSCQEEEEAARVRSLTMAARLRSTLRDDVTLDLKGKGGARQVRNSPFIGRRPNSPFLPRRPSSPFSSHRIIMATAAAAAEDRPPSPAVVMEMYKATMDYIPSDEDQHGLSLKTGQVVEVLEQLTAANRCFVQSTAITGEVEHGWVPASLLEPAEQPVLQQQHQDSSELDETDHGKQPRVKSVLFTDTSSSQQVISNLRRVTLGVDLGTPPPRSPTRSPTRSPVFSPKRLYRQGKLDGHDQETSLFPPSPETNGSTKMRIRERSKLRRNYGVRRKSSNRSSSQSGSEGESCLERTLGSSSEEEETVSITFGSSADGETAAEKEEEPVEVSPEQREKAEEKIKYIMAELVSTEKEYISKLDTLVTGFLQDMQSSSTLLPEPLKGKEKMIFGNVVAIYEFHRDMFQHSLVEANDSLEKTAQCFLDYQKNFQLYVSYCENKPKSESWLWTYTHNGGSFFTDIQKKLCVREDIASFLIKPVQRVTKYQLLLKDLMKTAQKTGSPVPLLESAVQLMKDVPKQANDAMALSMIVGYDGNIHANGAIILQDEFMVYEKVRLLGGARRHVFLLDSRLLITKEKDADGLYVFKDSLKVHSMTLTEKQGDHPCRFAVGTGQIGDWEQFYVLEASTPDRKHHWVRAIKEILNQQFEMLKALKQPTRPRLPGQDSLSYHTPPNGSPSLNGSDPAPKLSVTSKHQPTMDLGFSDSSLDDEEDGEEGGEKEVVEKPSPQRMRSVPAPPTITEQRKPSRFSRWKSVGDKKNREPVLYQVGEDCSAPAHGQNILHIKKGQVYDILDNSGEWWMARLIRDTDYGGSPRSSSRGVEGWVPATFMDPFTGQLEVEEYMFACYGTDEGAGSRSRSQTAPSKHRDTLSTPDTKTARYNRKSPRLNKKSKYQQQQQQQPLTGKPQFLSRISDETVLYGRPVQFRCQLAQEYPGQTVQWLHDGHPLTIDRAFTSEGQSCILKITDVHLEDEGVFTCVVRTPRGSSSCCAKLTVLGPPKPPTGLIAHPITSTSVSLTWDPPMITGNSPITLYLIECKDTIGNRWSTLMKRITEPCSVIDDLVPGVEYEFRVIAGNQIGSSQPSQGSEPVKLVRHTPLRPVFSVEPFDSQYSLQDQLARGQFSRLHECLHTSTQQEYVAKVFTMETGDHAQRELSIVCKLSHRNIVQMTGAYLSDIGYILVYQRIHGKGILEYLCDTDSPPSEHIVIHCCHQLFSALAYLHNHNIAHLRLKPENILLSAISCTGSLPDLKLIHFASAVELNSSHTLAPPTNTDLEFTAPEVLLKQPVSTATDMWSVGVLLYTMLGGHPPFLVDSVDLTKENIKNAHLSFSPRQFRGCNDAAKSLISQLLLRQSSDRLTASQCCKHSWVTDGGGEDCIMDTSRLSQYLLLRRNQCSSNH